MKTMLEYGSDHKLNGMETTLYQVMEMTFNINDNTNEFIM